MKNILIQSGKIVTSSETFDGDILIEGEKIKSLTIESIQDEIEATEYHIQALELDGDNISREDRKKILEAKAKIKTLERKIKEIELEYELNTK